MSAVPRELDLLPEKMGLTMPLSLRKSRICFLFELAKLHLHVTVVRIIVSCQNTDKILPRKRFVLMSGSEKFDLLMSEC